jgi:antitoxin component of MazEF toxin-antitoxin module
VNFCPVFFLPEFFSNSLQATILSPIITTLSPDLTTPVPEALIQRLNLHPGSQLDWQADGQVITIQVQPAAPDRLKLLQEVRALGRKNKRDGEDLIADFIRERVEEDEIRTRELAGPCE